MQGNFCFSAEGAWSKFSLFSTLKCLSNFYFESCQDNSASIILSNQVSRTQHTRIPICPPVLLSGAVKTLSLCSKSSCQWGKKVLLILSKPRESCERIEKLLSLLPEGPPSANYNLNALPAIFTKVRKVNVSIGMHGLLFQTIPRSVIVLLCTNSQGLSVILSCDFCVSISLLFFTACLAIFVSFKQYH